MICFNIERILTLSTYLTTNLDQEIIRYNYLVFNFNLTYHLTIKICFLETQGA